MNRFEKRREQWIDFAAEHSDALCAVMGFVFGIAILYTVMYVDAVY